METQHNDYKIPYRAKVLKREIPVFNSLEKICKNIFRDKVSFSTLWDYRVCKKSTFLCIYYINNY